MTPKEKTKELIERFKIINYDLDDIANHKECALIAVDEMIKQQKYQSENMIWSCVDYWQEVKQEIEKL
jgi:tRNA-dihydrouridine synthase